MSEISQDLQKAAKLLQEGKLVAIPTETVYGLAANAFNEEAVLKVFEAKSRPEFNPLIVHIASANDLNHIAKNIPDIGLQLLNEFSPGPLTLLLEKTDIISDLITAGSDLVAVRIPKHPLTRQLLTQLDFPLVAPSANPFGYVSPTTPWHVEEQLGNKLELILDGGQCEIGLESTIVGFEDNKILLHRLGIITPEEITVKFPDYELIIANEGKERPQAPGQLKSHYSPNKICYFGNIEKMLEEHQGKKLGAIVFRKYNNTIDINNQLLLSAEGSLHEAAKNLFSLLRKSETLNCDIVLLEEVENTGVGRAINDRLKRAAEN